MSPSKRQELIDKERKAQIKEAEKRKAEAEARIANAKNNNKKRLKYTSLLFLIDF